MALDHKYRQLEERYNFLQDQCTLPRKLQKTAIPLRDEMVSKAQRKIEELRARNETKINSKQAQNRILAGELVQQTRALEQRENDVVRNEDTCDSFDVWQQSESAARGKAVGVIPVEVAGRHCKRRGRGDQGVAAARTA
ncbi:hypothetical protein AXG93_3535s1010 [Marchantia polymorpha subsp. ruderalis]|uniref:Uncharacterized protein n=1 Tax=Marchantia polymorpha subsp. ruderalis TaxID=1480154 RepID=A0A176WAP9_MARPO|nr:hypothetical protein AXG93_3535s1010 [Marchantia polymorpha subsp. ruderalis]